MRRMTRTAILAAVCVAALLGGYGARAQDDTEPPQATPGQGGRLAVEPAAAQVANDDLEMELDESSGLPAPKRRTVITGDSAPYRNAVHLETPLDLPVVLGFYRAVLSKRGWTEDAQRAVVEADRAQLAFATADGPGLLKAVRQGAKTVGAKTVGAKTVIDLSQRDPDGAAKVGLLPKTGQAKVMLGNLFDQEAVITIDNRTIKVAAGVARTTPDGPKIDLPPGKYKLTFKLARRAAESEEVEVGADEAWGLLVAPVGLLPVQLY